MTGREFDPALDGEATRHSDIRNPWHGIHAGREFLFDMRHPVRFWKCAMANAYHVPQAQRKMGKAVMLVGGLNILVGLAAVVRGYLG